MCLAVLGSLALELARSASRIARDVTRVVSAARRGPPAPPARGYEDEWDMV